MIIYAVVLIVLMIFTWNPKCIELRKEISAKFKSFFSKKNRLKRRFINYGNTGYNVEC